MTLSPRERNRTRRFAAALDGGPRDPGLAGMLRVATALGTAGAAVCEVAPSEQFKAALRQRLLAVAAVTPVTGTSGPGAIVGGGWRRRLIAASTVVAIAAGGVVGTTVVSNNALPGEALYGVKRSVEGVHLALATSDLSKAERYLDVARARLIEVYGLLEVAGPRPTDPVVVEELRKTLGDLSAAVEMARVLFFEAYNRTGDARVLQPLEDFLRQLGQELAALTLVLPRQLLPTRASLLASLDVIAHRLPGTTARLPDQIPSLRPGSGATVPPPSAPPAGPSAGPSGGRVTDETTPTTGRATVSSDPAGEATTRVQPSGGSVTIDLGGSTGVGLPKASVSAGRSGGQAKPPWVSGGDSSQRLLGVTPAPEPTASADVPTVADLKVDLELPGAGR